MGVWVPCREHLLCLLCTGNTPNILLQSREQQSPGSIFLGYEGLFLSPYPDRAQAWY